MTWTEVTRNCWKLEVVPGTGIGAVIDRTQSWPRDEARGLPVFYRIDFLGNRAVWGPEETDRA